MSKRHLIKALFIEDDDIDFEAFERAFSTATPRFEVTRVETLQSAFESIEHESFDAVLTDLSLPDSEGFATVKLLRSRCGRTPIIVLTGSEDEGLATAVLEAGAQDYLLKTEVGSRQVIRPVIHAVQRQQTLNEVVDLVRQLESREADLKQNALLLEKKNKRLEQLCRTAQEFVDSVSHDFRTPLTVINDFVAIIRDGLVGEVNAKQRSLLDKVALRADDLNHMVDDLLDVSRIESGILGVWRRRESPNRLVERSLAHLRDRARIREVALTSQCDSPLPDIYCDPEKIDRVLTNLVINAIKFVGSEGSVQVWVRHDPENSQVIFGVTDNGPGIEADSLERLFRRFEQASQPGTSIEKGFGLGLAISSRLCRLNLSELHVESEAGQGSTFSFCLPIHDPREVFQRWLDHHDSENPRLELHLLSVLDSTHADTFDSFLACLLQTNELLFRAEPAVWLHLSATDRSESSNLGDRVKLEFQRHNRNRPIGALPKYRIQELVTIDGDYSRSMILDQVQKFSERNPCDHEFVC